MRYQLLAEEHALDDRDVGIRVLIEARQRVDGDQASGGLKAPFMRVVADRVQVPGHGTGAGQRRRRTRTGAAHMTTPPRSGMGSVWRGAVP